MASLAFRWSLCIQVFTVERVVRSQSQGLYALM